MVRISRCVFVCLLSAALTLLAPASAFANSKYAAYVMHADSGDVLFDKYSTQYRYPASITKVMTLYLLFEELEAGRLTPSSKLRVSARAAGQPPSKLGVKSGTTIDVETAIHALVVKSSNDVAVVVAEAISGTEWKFAKKMTNKARSLGMRRTTFRNASGLPNRRQVTTARDLAVLAQRIMHDFPQYYHYFGAKSFAWKGRTYRTHNALVRNFNGADGLKTGYTRRSGFNLATTVTRDGHRLIGVVLGGRSVRTRDAHMRKIMDSGFAKIKRRPMLISALHRVKPEPRMKPTLVAELAAAKAVAKPAAPTIGDNIALQETIANAAASMTNATPGDDALGALIAAADSDDFNQFERVRLAAAKTMSAGEEFGEGDFDKVEILDWSVQIGAYSDKALAQQELEAAAIAAQLTDRTRIVSPMTMNDGRQLFRARFAYLTQGEARELCEQVRAASITCFALREPGSLVNAEAEAKTD